MHIRKFISTVVLSVLASMAVAQNGLNIPFSQYGLGYGNAPYNMPFAASMGGVVLTRSASNSVNPFNPASYAAIGTQSFVFDMGVSIETTRQTDPNTSLFDADGNIGYIAFAMPITKWWKTGFGLLPYTDVNYQSINTVSDPLLGDQETVYEGTGGVSRFFWGHAFNLGKRLSVGFNMNYLYGAIHRGITYEFGGYDSAYYMNSRREKNTRVSNLILDFGLQYAQPLGEHNTLNIGLTATTPRTMSVSDNAIVYTFVEHAGSLYGRDTIFPLSGESGDYTSTIEQPLEVGLGLSWDHNKKWLVALDANYSPWSGIKYTENTTHQIFGNTAVTYGDNYRLALGGQWLGDPAAAKYLNRIKFSAGFHYEQGKLRLQLSDGNEWSLDDMGFGLGASLPMRKGRSVLNLSVAFDSYGTPDLLRRNAVTFGVSVGSCESWFVKRKYN